MIFSHAQHRSVSRGANLRWLGVVGMGLLLLAGGWSATATPVVAILRNGDRITGDLVAQETNQVIIATGWAGTLTLPLSSIGGLQTTTGDKLIPAPEPPKPPPPPPAAKPAPAKPAAPSAKPAAKGKLTSNLQLGSALTFGARDQNLVYARLKSTYAKPYEWNPQKYFRLTADLAGDYGETDGVRSANRISGSLRTDFDLNDKTYFYNVFTSGFDEIRKIDFQYSVGPGFGYRAVKQAKFELNFEGGVDYQDQERSSGGDTSSAYLRLSDNLTWQIAPRLRFTKRFEYFLDGQATEKCRLRLDATLSYQLLDSLPLNLNLNLLDLYDTNPAPGVNRNELQLRSTIGITF